MQEQWQKIRTQLLADKRKLGIMICLGLVAVGMWVRVIASHSPPKALAATTPTTANDQTDTTASTTYTAPQRTSRSNDTVALAEATSLKRNLFSFAPAGYRSTKPSNFQSITAKSTVESTDVQVRLAKVQQAAAGLTLQSVITGDHPKAVIDGQLVGVGDTVQGFTLKKVHDRQAVLEMNGIVVRLGM